MSESSAEAPGLPPALIRRELVAAALVVVVGMPIVGLFGAAALNGERRTREAPFRAVLGDERYEELAAGESGFPHYLGRERLAPDFELPDRAGETWRLADHRGQVVVMNFWSITCGPCLEELPSVETLAEIAERWDDVAVVAVSTDAGWDAVSSVIPAEPHLTHLFDPGGSTAVRELYGTELYPETWIIDKEGVVRFRFDGARDWSDPIVLELIERFR